MPRILLIEDNAIAALDFSTLLRSQGFEVLEAQTGELALEMVAEQSPDIIISNIYLLGMDGFAVLQALRNNLATAAIRFIFLSTEVCSPTCRRALQLGANDLLSKPIDGQELLDAVDRQLN